MILHQSRRTWRLAPIILLGLWAISCRAGDVLTIKITQGVEGALPIAVVPFHWIGGAGMGPLDIAAVVNSDLARSGRFAPIPKHQHPAHSPQDPAAVDFSKWRQIGAGHLVMGEIRALRGGYEITFRLLDVYKGSQLAGFKIPASKRALRLAAHRIADIIHERLTGEPGVAASRIAYITVNITATGRIFRLLMADADAHNPQVLLESSKPLLSPSFSPDGKRIAYVSFEHGDSAIYIQEIRSGRRELMASGRGINSAPAFSPDGGRLAMTRSRDGDPEIYVLDLASRQFTRVTHNPAIDTEPAFAPDGKSLIFTSDRGGSPQIYRIDLARGQIQRVTFDQGKYNVNASFSPDGKRLIFVHQEGRDYRIAAMELSTGRLRILTSSRLDESPNFAPNGAMLIYTTMGDRGTELAAISIDGRIKHRLLMTRGEVREPIWGPLPADLIQ